MVKRILHIKRYQIHNANFFILLGIIALFFVQPFISIVFADSVLTLEANLSGDPSSVETGEIITYIIDFSCASTTGDCGALNIDFTLDPNTEFIEVIPSSGYTASQSSGPPSVVTITDEDGNFAGGDASQAVVRVRVKHDLLGGETISPTLVGTITAADATPPTVNQGVPTVNVTAPTEQWSVNKIQVNPPNGIGPAEDGTATYQVQFCSDSATGNLSLNNAQLVDTFPAGASVVGNPDGGIVSAGPPPTISWPLGTLDIATIGSGCVNRNYTLYYPVGSFPLGSSIANNVEGFGENPNFSTSGPCGTNCIGTTSTGGKIEPPTVNPLTGKIGPGTTYVTPGGGVSDFFLSFNLDNANFPADNVTFTDILPLAASTISVPPGIPAISVIQIQSGTWVGGYPAVVEWLDSSGGWNSIATVDGSSNITWLSGQLVTDDFPGPPQDFSNNSTTNIIYGVRWRFTDPQLPAGFSFTSNPVASFIPREGMPAGDYDSGLGYRDYQNCVNATYGVDGGAPITTTDVCAPARLSTAPGDFANINWN